MINIFILGDTHMLAFDNGRNNDDGGFPVAFSGPLDM